MAGLMVALGASACADDPSVEFGGDAPTKIQASPTVMFVNQGAREEILFRLVDDRNRSTPTSFEISNVGAGITVELDDEYRPDYIGSDELEFNPIQHQHRYYVTANSPVGTQFTVSSGGISQVIKVNVVPSELPLSTDGGNGATTATAITSADFVFSMETVFSIDGVSLPLLSVSEDGHTANVVLPGGLNDATLTVEGARASYMPTVALPALPAAEGISTPAAPNLGENAFETAPTLTLDPTADQWGWVGGGAFTGPDDVGGGGPMKWYKLVVPTDIADATISLDWDTALGGDLDVFLVDGGFTTILGSAANGNNADHPPEEIHHALPAGEYYVGVLLYQGEGAPVFFRVLVHETH
jgi:hypothetical protein